MAEPPAEVALDEEDLGIAARIGAVDQLAGKAQLARRVLAADLFFATALEPILGLVDRPFEETRRLLRAVGEPMIEGVADRVLDDAGGFLRRETILGLALEFRLANEDRKHPRRGAENVLGGDLRGFLVAGEFTVGAQALHQGGAEALLVRAAFGRRHGIAVGVEEAVLVADPAHRPLDRAVPFFLLDAAGEEILRHPCAAVDRGRQVVLEAAGEMKHRLGRRIVLDQFGVAEPADLDAAEQIRFRPRHLEQSRRA